MATAFDQMKKEILAQKDAYEKLLRLAEQKRQALTDSDVHALDAVVQAEDEVLKHLSTLEAKRLAIAKRVAAETCIPAEELTLRSWPGLSEQERQEVAAFQEAFLATLHEVDLLNQVNSKLLSVQLDYVQQMMKDVAQIRESDSYSQKGDKQSRKTQENRLIDAIL